MAINYDRQAKLAESAQLPELQALSKGANPRLVQPFVALGALNARMAQMQSDKMLQGAAAPGSLPTLKDKIEQSLQQMKTAALRQQAAQRAAMQAPGMFQVPQGVPQPEDQPEAPEAQMYAGGVARLPVRDDMFGYAGGGIIAFNGEEQSDVPEGLTREEAEAIRRRMKQRTDMTPEKMDVTDLDFTSIPGMEKSNVLAKAMEIARGEGKERPDNTDVKKALAFASAPLAAAADVALSIPKGIQSLAGWSFRNPLETKPEGPNFTSVMDARNQFLADGKEPQTPVTGTVVPAPTGKPQLQGPRTLVGDAATEQDRLAKAHAAFQSGQKMVGGYTLSQAIEKARERLEAEGKKLTPDDVRVIQRRFEGATPDAGSVGIKTLPGAKPPVAKPPVTKPPAAAPEQDQEAKLMDMLMKQFGPQPAQPSIEESLAKRDKYVQGAPSTPEALAMLKHYDDMAKRFAANDEAEKAQQAINQRNNLWTLLSNVKGSTLGAAAGRANAALQPLLESQESRRQSYQKLRDEQEMLLGKSRYELAAAERARKEGRYSEAEKHQMEAQKLAEQARGHNIQGLGSLINAAGVREDRRLSREQQYQMHRERMGELGQRRTEMQMEANRIKDAAERTQRENAYTRASAKNKEAIAKAQKMLDLPDLPKEMKQRAEDALARLTKEDNDMYERIVVRGDKDYRPQASGAPANSALMSKADKIVGGK